MIIRFDAEGQAMPDTQAPAFARQAVLENRDVHVSNSCVLTWLRAALLEIPKPQRPAVTWILCGEETEFDDDLRSPYWPKETEVEMEAMEILMGHMASH